MNRDGMTIMNGGVGHPASHNTGSGIIGGKDNGPQLFGTVGAIADGIECTELPGAHLRRGNPRSCLPIMAAHATFRDWHSTHQHAFFIATLTKGASSSRSGA